MKKNIIIGLFLGISFLCFLCVYNKEKESRVPNEDIKEKEKAEFSAPVEENYYILENTDNSPFDITNFQKESIGNIVDKIKMNDKEFNLSDYKVSYSVVNPDEGYGHILFTYYIDDKIETNKVYLVTVKDNKIQDITLGGVKKKNIKNIKNVNKNVFNEKINSFEINKKETEIMKSNVISKKESMSVLNSKNAINEEALSNETEKVVEKYYYDFNEEKLYYILTQYEKRGDIYLDGNELKVEIQ